MEGDFFPKAATGFGAGIGRKGSLCGALTASTMIIGLLRGRTDPQDQERKEETYSMCAQLWEAFEKEFGSCYCFNLTKCRFEDSGERQRWLDSGGMERCAHIVGRAAELLFEALEKASR